MKRKFSIVLTVIIMFGIMFVPTKLKAAESSLKAGKINISSGWLNVRTSATADSQSLATLKKDSYVTLVSKSGNWWLVEYADGKYGYCSAYYITVFSDNVKYVNISSGSLNVRSGAGSSYSKTDTLEKQEKVIVLSTSGNWSFVLYDGVKTGYVSSWYLSDTAMTYSVITLSVPSFKQTDSRWASVKLGTSGKTIAEIGCATTGIAMMESYRTGTTIYPDAMSNKLKYTSSGSVYWPSNFTSVTSSSNYLAKIYEKLKSGKPVLFGAKNKYGGQHWVVITGFKGGDSLSASKFTVNDPGSKDRTTLQDLLNTHPNFYKYFYY